MLRRIARIVLLVLRRALSAFVEFCDSFAIVTRSIEGSLSYPSCVLRACESLIYSWCGKLFLAEHSRKSARVAVADLLNKMFKTV